MFSMKPRPMSLTTRFVAPTRTRAGEMERIVTSLGRLIVIAFCVKRLPFIETSTACERHVSVETDSGATHESCVGEM